MKNTDSGIIGTKIVLSSIKTNDIHHLCDFFSKPYLSYGIITSGTCNIQAHYGHTTIGITDIGVGIKNGEVTLTPKLGAQITQYDARPVTVK